MGAELITKFGKQPRRYHLDASEVYRIGRTPQNTIQLPNDEVSRDHAMVQANDASVFYLYDLCSRNGTYVNGCRITMPMRLRDGDVISIGGFKFRFVQSVVQAEPECNLSSRGETVPVRSVSEITVLVMDIRGYTNLCQHIGEARVAEIMRTFNSETGAVLTDLNAWGVKYIGDAVMAIWVHRDSRAPFLIAALRAISALEEIAGSLQPRFGLESPVLLSAAMHIGMASIGNMGSKASADYTALGDVVNKVFRLAATSQELQADVVISKEAYNVLLSEINIERLMTAHEVQLKGYADWHLVYAMNRQALLGLLENLGSQRGREKRQTHKSDDD